MAGLRFFECRECATVHADPAVPPYCSECDGTAFGELTADLQTDTYFFQQSGR